MMKRRNHKSKAARDKDDYMTSGSNELSDVFYTTESNNTQFYYRDRSILRNYDDYDDYYTSEYFEKYIPKSENLDFEGYTSGTSYSERKQRRSSPGSKSEKIYSRRYSNSPTRQRHKHQSPKRDYGAMVETRRGSRPKNRARNSLGSASEQTLGYRPRSPRKRDNSYMYDDMSYEKYFEPAESKERRRSFERSEKRGRMQERAEKEVKDKKRQKSPKQQREYQVYAYQDDKPHERVFMRRPRVNGNSPVVSETELKTHEYPVLAFKDRNNIDAKDSDMVYVPVLVLDKSNKIKHQTVPPAKRSPVPQGDFQVYAANLENKNLFETMGDANYKKTLSGSHNRHSLIEQNHSLRKNSALNAELQVESFLNQTLYSSSPSDGQYSRETKATEKPPFGNNQTPIVYQVNVDVAPKVENESKRMSHTRQSTRDHLHDDYPVTKDYIKVNDGEEKRNSSFVEKLSSFVKPSRQSTKPDSQNPSIFVDVITNDKISHSISDSKDATRHKSIVRGSFPTRNQSIREEVSPKRSINVGNQNMLEESLKTSMVEAKSGSLAIPSWLDREDGAEIKNTQGVTRLSSAADGAEKQRATRQSTKSSAADGAEKQRATRQSTKSSAADGAEKQRATRQSTKEHLIRQSNVSPLSRVSHPSPIVTMAKQPSISEARAYETMEKKLSVIQSRPSSAKPQNRSSTPIAESIPESRKSLAKKQVANDPEPQTMTVSPIEVHLKESKKSLAPSQPEVTASLNEQIKSKDFTEAEITTSEPKPLSRSPTNTHNIEESEEDLNEFTKTVFQHTMEPKNASSSQNEVDMKSEVKPDENAKQSDSKKSQALVRESKEPSVLGSENFISVVNFSQDIKDINTPSSKDVPNNEETTPSIKVQTSSKSAQEAKENHSRTVAQSNVQPLEQKKVDERESTVNKPASQKSETSVKTIRFASRLFKSKSKSSHKGVGDTGSKSLVSKRSKQSVAKEKKTDTKKTPSKSKSIFGLLKRSKSNASNTSVSPVAPERSVPPQEESRQEKNARKEKKPEEPKPCDCLTAYVKNGRECAHFFLGTTLHEQVMKTLQFIC